MCWKPSPDNSVFDSTHCIKVGERLIKQIEKLIDQYPQMNDKFHIELIKAMDKDELFEEVMTYPEYLTDGYYNDLRDAINERYEELTNDNCSN